MTLSRAGLTFCIRCWTATTRSASDAQAGCGVVSEGLEGGRGRLLHIDQQVFLGVFGVSQQKNISLYPQAAGPATRKAASITWNRPFSSGILVEQLVEMGHQGFAQRLFEWEKADTVDPELEAAVLSFFRPLPDELLLFAFGDLFQKGADDAVGGLVLEVFGLSLSPRVSEKTRRKSCAVWVASFRLMPRESKPVKMLVIIRATSQVAGARMLSSKSLRSK